MKKNFILVVLSLLFTFTGQLVLENNQFTIVEGANYKSSRDRIEENKNGVYDWEQLDERSKELNEDFDNWVKEQRANETESFGSKLANHGEYFIFSVWILLPFLFTQYLRDIIIVLGIPIMSILAGYTYLIHLVLIVTFLMIGILARKGRRLIKNQ